MAPAPDRCDCMSTPLPPAALELATRLYDTAHQSACPDCARFAAGPRRGLRWTEYDGALFGLSNFEASAVALATAYEMVATAGIGTVLSAAPAASAPGRWRESRTQFAIIHGVPTIVFDNEDAMRVRGDLLLHALARRRIALACRPQHAHLPNYGCGRDSAVPFRVERHEEYLATVLGGLYMQICGFACDALRMYVCICGRAVATRAEFVALARELDALGLL